MSELNITMVKSVVIELRGKGRKQKPVAVVTYSDAFDFTSPPDTFSVDPGNVITLTGRLGGRIGFVSKPKP